MDDGSQSFVPTRCSTAKNIADEYIEVVYNNPKKKKKYTPSTPNIIVNKSNNSGYQEFDMKSAKYEVKRLVRSNVKASDRQKTLRELVVELGAKRPPRTSVNYKVILALKDKKKYKLKKLVEKESNGKTKTKRWKKKPKVENKSRNGLLNVYGKAKSKDVSSINGK